MRKLQTERQGHLQATHSLGEERAEDFKGQQEPVWQVMTVVVCEYF